MVELLGADKVIADLEKLADTTKLQDAMMKACLVVERDAKKNCPVMTGELRASITSQVENKGGEVQGQVGSPLMYANYVEYGTGLFSSNGLGRKDVPWYYQNDKGEWVRTYGQHPQPFLIPALNDNRTEILEQLKGAFNL